MKDKSIKEKWYNFLEAFEDNPIYATVYTFGTIMVFASLFAIINGIAAQPAASIMLCIGIVFLVFSLTKILGKRKNE